MLILRHMCVNKALLRYRWWILCLRCGIYDKIRWEPNTIPLQDWRRRCWSRAWGPSLAKQLLTQPLMVSTLRLIQFMHPVKLSYQKIYWKQNFCLYLALCWCKKLQTLIRVKLYAFYAGHSSPKTMKTFNFKLYNTVY